MAPGPYPFPPFLEAVVHVRNNAGQASAPGGFYWDQPGDVVEVPDALGNDLVRLNPNDFEEVQPDAEVQSEVANPEGPAPFTFDPQFSDVTSAVNEFSQDSGATFEAVPEGTAAEVLDWVGADRERAVRALEAERAKGEAARSSLIPKLEKLAAE